MDSLFNYYDENLWEEKWKHDYKYGVILFIPPEPIKSFVDSLRSRYDPKSYSSCVAHISLTMPIKHELTSDNINNLENSLVKFKSFKVTYGPVINFLPAAPGIVFNIKEQKEFENLYKFIESISNIDFYPRKWPFKAHLTIAEFLDDSETIELTNKLNTTLEENKLYGEFLCKNVSYMVPDQEFVFREMYKFNLGI